MKSKWTWIIISGLAWPGVQYLLGVYRFGANNPNTDLLQAFSDFALTGLVAGWIYFFVKGKASNKKQAKYTAVGYFVAFPFAFFLSWAGGLNIIGPVIYGALPLLLGAWLGKLFGGMGSAG